MLERRLELHSKFVALLGSHNVYFQPSSNVQMKYPAIVYERNVIDNKHANDNPYAQSLGYTVKVIDKNPDSEIVKKVAQLPMCRFDRHYVADNLNHDVFTLYY